MPPVTKEDGRHARKARTREAIVSALLELLDEGVSEPTAAQMAARAKVAVRSIGQHFKSREELLLAVAGRHSARLPTPTPPSPTRSFDARLAHFVSTRVRVLEASAAVRRAAQRGAGASKAITKALAETARKRRDELRASLGAELKKAPSWAASAAETMASGAAWDALRQEQRLSPAAAEQVIVQALKKLIG